MHRLVIFVVLLFPTFMVVSADNTIKVESGAQEMTNLLDDLKNLYVKKDCAGVIEMGKAAAESGNARAQLYLAKCYEHTIQEQGHREKTLHWYRLSVEGGDALACVYLGVLYMGSAVRDQNENLATEACDLFKCAADAGNEMGINYYNAYACDK